MNMTFGKLTIGTSPVQVSNVALLCCKLAFQVEEPEVGNLPQGIPIAMANPGCSTCHGYGAKPGRRGKDVPCACVFRAIFKACLRHYRAFGGDEGGPSKVSRCLFAKSGIGYSRKREEYRADFYIIARRLLTAEQFTLFQAHYVRGLDWHACTNILKVNRGEFFHAVYRVEEILGRAYGEQSGPCQIYPLREYFNNVWGGTIPHRSSSNRQAGAWRAFCK